MRHTVDDGYPAGVQGDATFITRPTLYCWSPTPWLEANSRTWSANTWPENTGRGNARLLVSRALNGDTRNVPSPSATSRVHSYIVRQIINQTSTDLHSVDSSVSSIIRLMHSFTLSLLRSLSLSSLSLISDVSRSSLSLFSMTMAMCAVCNVFVCCVMRCGWAVRVVVAVSFCAGGCAFRSSPCGFSSLFFH